MMDHSCLQTLTEDIAKAIEFTKKEFSGLQTGRASAGLVEDLQIEVYGAKQALKHVANITVPSAQQIMIDPWDKSQLQAIEKAIADDPNLGLAPSNNGAAIFLNIPPLTQERRRDLVKIVHQKNEHGKITIRQARQHAMDAIKKDEGLSEDEQKMLEKKVQDQIDTANKDVDELTKHKEAEVMKV